MTLARIMAEYATSLWYESLPAEVVTAARRPLADGMSCAVAAYPTEAISVLRRYALARGGQEDATLVGTASKVPVGAAALVNGTAVRYLDANDIFAFSRGHDSGHFSDATPTILALAEYAHEVWEGQRE